MGVKIIAKGVDAEAYAKEYAAPVRRALEGVFFLNTGLEKAAHNYAPAKTKGTVIGAPVPVVAATKFKSMANYILTDITETDAMTIFVLARSELDGTDQSNRAVLISNYDTTVNPPGLGIYVQNTNRMSAFGSFGADAASNVVVASSVNSTKVVTDWNLYAAIIQPGGVTLRNLTTGQSGTVANAAARRKNPAKLRIGSSATSYTGFCDIALAQIHSAALTEAEILATAADLKAYAARRGINL